MAGKVFEENSITTSGTDLSGGGKVVVETDAYVWVTGDQGIFMSPAAWTVAVDGSIRAATGIHFGSNLLGASVPSSKLAVGAEGSIISSDASTAGVFLGVPVDIANAGLIQGELYGVHADFFGPTSSKGFTIT